MARKADVALQAKILQVGFVVVFLCSVLYAVRGLMFGSRSIVGLVSFIVVGAAAVFLLDDKYWLACPVLAIFGFRFPIIPLDGVETGCLLIVVVYFVRMAIRRDLPPTIGWDVLVLFPLLFWIAVVFCINPTGLVMFGSSKIGGRFYFDILVAVLALFVLSSQRIDEKGARLLFFALLIAQIAALTKGIAFPTETDDDAAFVGGDVVVSSRYALIGCISVYTLLFARYSLSQIMRSFSKILLFSTLGLLTIYSGKRRAFGTLAVVPVLRMFLAKRDRLLTCAMVVLAAVFLCLAAMGDGKYYELPWSAKRALSVVFPQYRKDGVGGMHDFFREQMREQAREVIRRDPWFGRKGFAMDFQETAWIRLGSGYTSIFAGHAYSGNWHSAWFAYAADFGIPGLLFYAIFLFYILRYSWRGVREVQIGRYLPACCLYFSFSIFLAAVFSYTSGHSSRTLVSNCIDYGMLLAIVRGYRSRYGSVS